MNVANFAHGWIPSPGELLVLSVCHCRGMNLLAAMTLAVAIVKMSGCGKHTLIRLIYGDD